MYQFIIMKELLLSEKWRPKSIKDIILLPRIKKIFENGITQNMILYGHYGTGKTTSARVLIGKYLKNKAYIEINSSFYTSIDTLRTKIDDFCSKVYMGLDLDNVEIDPIKYVFLDEFERTSIQYQDALKAYIEEYSAKNVRFILNTNHLNKISEGIKSRISLQVNFDCISPEEEKYLKEQFYFRIKNVIAPAEGIEVAKDEIAKIINKRFPDFRAVMNDLQSLKETGETSIASSNIDSKIRTQLFSLVYDKQKTYEDIYHFLMDNFGADSIDEMIELFGKNFVLWSFSEKRENIDKLFKVNYIISEHSRLLETNIDPIILGMTVIGKIRDLF